MNFLIQQGLFSGKHEGKLIDYLWKYELPYSYFRQIPFVDEVDLLDCKLDLSKPTWIFGSIRAEKVFKEKYPEIKPGTFYNENHDFLVYRDYYKDNLLNYDSKIITTKFDISEYPHDEFFARPTHDSKVFTGKVFTKQEWKDFVDRESKNGYSNSLNEETPIQLSSCKKILSEIRAFIIKGQLVTASYYQKNGYSSFELYLGGEAEEFINRMIKEYTPAESFVMDVCLIEPWRGYREHKIVELGCINSCGFYDIDLSKLLQTIVKEYDPEDTIKR